MSMRPLLALAAALASGCTVVTSIDDDFLNLQQPDADTTPPDCTDVYQLVETEEGCWDRCDNDEDGLVDCDDTDCRNYCCTRGRVERLACNDSCDNDHDTLIDCADPDCAGTAHCTPPQVAEGICRGEADDPDCCNAAQGDIACCSNGLDDDLDGLFDCDDPGCAPTDFCCGIQFPHVDRGNQMLDEDYWVSFGSEDGPTWNSYDRVADWNEDGDIAGAVTALPINLDFGLHVSFNVAVTADSPCYMPWDCDAFSGIALGPAPTPRDGEDPSVHLSVLVTSSRRVIVTRGPVGAGRILHSIGLDAPIPGYEGPPVVYNVTVDLTPATDANGENGYRMRLSVPMGREVCHEDGTIIGCPEEPEWESEDLVLFEGEDVLLNDERGAFLVLGRGAGVEFSDHADTEGSETVSVGVRSCANPTAWEPVGDPRRGDDRITNAALCWAVAGLGSGSVARIPETEQSYVMVTEGTTEQILPAGIGINNFSLGFLTTSNDPDVSAWDQLPDDANLDDHRYWPIDVARDVNCVGLEMSDYSDPTCLYAGTIMPSPAELDDVCRGARSHRSPFLIAGGDGTHRVLYSEAVAPGSLSYGIAAADYTPHLSRWDQLGEEHQLTVDDVELATGRRYTSLRDPVAICHPASTREDSCQGVYMVLVVGEPDTSLGEPWTGDELIYIEYDLVAGFATSSIFVTLGDTYASGSHPELDPLLGRYLAEPWIELYDDGITPPRYFVWVTTSQPNHQTQVDLLLVDPDGNDETSHPLVIDDDQNGSGATWTLYPGSPVLTARDLELLYPSTDWRAADCSGSCEIGGITGVVVRNPELGRDRLHIWVSVAERPATDASPKFLLRHLVQPFGLP